jgi:hypothetical protein
MLDKQNRQQTFVDMLDTIRKGLPGSLNYNPEEKGQEVSSKISEVLHLTSDADTLGMSTVNLEAMQNRMMHTNEYAKQLANSRERNAEQAAEINTPKQQMHQLTAMMADQNKQGDPHLSGSRATHP